LSIEESDEEEPEAAAAGRALFSRIKSTFVTKFILRFFESLT
jgi:hypothetical protein